MPRLRKNKVKGRVLALFVDGFSRFASLNYQKDAKASTTLKSFEHALEHDFGAPSKYKYYLSDRGTEFKVHYTYSTTYLIHTAIPFC